MAILAVLVAGITSAAVVLPASSPRATPPTSSPTSLAPTTTSSPHPATSTPVPTVLAAGQTRVTGRVTLLTATDAVAAPIGLPVTVTVPQRGTGGMKIVGVSVDGQPAEIDWFAGQPLPFSGTGSFDLGPAKVVIDGGGITWHLDAGQRVLRPGRYTAGAPVAVGGGGLAQPRDSVTFVAAAGSGAGFVTNGDAQLHLPKTTIRLDGPGGVHLSGAMSVTTGTARPRAATTVTFGPGPFVIALYPIAGGTGYLIDALLQGPVTAT